MFAFCFRDQVFAKMLEMLSSLPAAKLLESNFEEVLEGGGGCLKSGFTNVQCTGYMQYDVMSYCM